ncbi:EH domain-containing protein 1-like [Camellia sinensis]|uniref:EH domain-containing protein 1-like n=1 Tax=Camellia sinensis TaxID=4442 RepID=UPI001036E5E9|nr:EH domain-containing protein 1-like [Camellia sinensis]
MESLFCHNGRSGDGEVKEHESSIRPSSGVQCMMNDYMSYASSDLFEMENIGVIGVGTLNYTNPDLSSLIHQVWAIADSKRQGFIGFKEFITAIQIAGHELNKDLLKVTDDREVIKPPLMEGMDDLLAVSSHIIYSFYSYFKRRLLVPLTFYWCSSSSRSIRVLKAMTIIRQYYATAIFLSKFVYIKIYQEGAHIGPEPTTDRFVIVMLIVLPYSRPNERSILGNTIAINADMPFSGLTTFGGSFLSKFE